MNVDRGAQQTANKIRIERRAVIAVGHFLQHVARYQRYATGRIGLETKELRVLRRQFAPTGCLGRRFVLLNFVAQVRFTTLLPEFGLCCYHHLRRSEWQGDVMVGRRCRSRDGDGFA